MRLRYARFLGRSHRETFDWLNRSQWSFHFLTADFQGFSVDTRFVKSVTRTRGAENIAAVCDNSMVMFSAALPLSLFRESLAVGFSKIALAGLRVEISTNFAGSVANVLWIMAFSISFAEAIDTIDSNLTVAFCISTGLMVMNTCKTKSSCAFYGFPSCQ